MIGTKNFPEEYILGELYKQALEAKGFNVSDKENIGSTQIVQLPSQAGRSTSTPSTWAMSRMSSTIPTYRILEQRRKSPVVKASRAIGPVSDTVRRHRRARGDNATAKKYGLKTISDLSKVGAFKLGGFPECQTRNTCFVGYTKQYGLKNASFASVGSVSHYQPSTRIGTRRRRL